MAWITQTKPNDSLYNQASAMPLFRLDNKRWAIKKETLIISDVTVLLVVLFIPKVNFVTLLYCWILNQTWNSWILLNFKTRIHWILKHWFQLVVCIGVPYSLVMYYSCMHCNAPRWWIKFSNLEIWDHCGEMISLRSRAKHDGVFQILCSI